MKNGLNLEIYSVNFPQSFPQFGEEGKKSVKKKHYILCLKI